MSHPTAKQVVHVGYPGPLVSGGAPAKEADKHVAGARGPACRKRPSPLKGTVNQWETAEARASPRTPENTGAPFHPARANSKVSRF